MSMLLERDRAADVRVRLLAKTLGEKTNTGEGWEKGADISSQTISHHRMPAPFCSLLFSHTHAWLIFQWGAASSACDHLKQSDEEKSHLNLGVQALRKERTNSILSAWIWEVFFLAACVLFCFWCPHPCSLPIWMCKYMWGKKTIRETEEAGGLSQGSRSQWSFGGSCDYVIWNHWCRRSECTQWRITRVMS